MEIDLLYTLGTGSRWNDNELRYSLRSVEKHVKNYRNVIIVGECPNFIDKTKVLHIPFIEINPINSAKNIMQKVYVAFREEQVSNEILHLNDDYFFCYDIDAPTFPYYYKALLSDTIIINASTEYAKFVKVTIEELQKRELPLKNFDIHKPIRYEREKFKQVVESYDWEKYSHGYILHTLYCNTLGIVGTFKKDCKINHSHLKDNWHRIVKRNTDDLFSIGDISINKEFKRFCDEVYPNKSKYEI